MHFYFLIWKLDLYFKSVSHVSSANRSLQFFSCVGTVLLQCHRKPSPVSQFTLHRHILHLSFIYFFVQTVVCLLNLVHTSFMHSFWCRPNIHFTLISSQSCQKWAFNPLFRYRDTTAQFKLQFMMPLDHEELVRYTLSLKMVKNVLLQHLYDQDTGEPLYIIPTSLRMEGEYTSHQDNS